VLFLFWLFLFFGVAGALYLLSRVPLPPASAQAQAQTTFIYDAGGHQLAAVDSGQNRVLVHLNEIPQVVVDAVLSTEDRNYYHHGAVDPIGLVRAAVSDALGHGNLQGASTITQQYVKKVYVGSQRTLLRKAKEAALAVKLERQLSKQQILERYLNTIYFGRGAYGIEAAAQAYFGEDVSKLGLPEASFLAGAIRAPQTDDPYQGYEATATARRLLTLKALVRDHKITQAELEQVSRTPVIHYVRPAAATRLTVNDASHGTQYFVDFVRQQLIARYGKETVLTGGLRVYTTLDTGMQDEAWKAVYGQPNGLQPNEKKEPAGALVSIDDKGQVKAMVGGEDYNKSQVNLAVGKQGGGTGRQAGSTFKAFLLAETVKDGYSVESTFAAPPKIILKGQGQNGQDYPVQNFQNEDGGASVNLIDATANSMNTVYAQLEMAIGAPKLVQMATKLGINAQELAPNASLVLGTSEVSVLEMAGAYSTFADAGNHIQPHVVTKVTAANGTPLPWPQPAVTPVLTKQQTDTITYCLQQVVQRGTGTAAALYNQPIAGKTGTTEDYADAWFIGYTPHLTTAVWMGYPEGSTHKMTDVRGIKPGIQGGSIPAQTFNRFMTAALANPAYRGTFDSVNTFTGTTLSPPSGISYPNGTGSTTTVFTTSTTKPPTTSTTMLTTTTTQPATTTSSIPPTTRPTTTSVPITVPTPTTRPTSTTAAGT
jgi:penicillin-binding protein 1A